MSALPNHEAAPDNTTGIPPDTAAKPHSAHANHPAALRLRAAALYSEGLRSPAIADELGVPERTVRAWLADVRADFFAQHADCTSVGEYLAVAIERQLTIAAGAWRSFHRTEELEQLALNYYHAGLNRTARLKNIDEELPPPPPRPSAAPARFLSVALTAQREAARIAGCYNRTNVIAASAAEAEAFVSRRSAATSATSAVTATAGPASTPVAASQTPSESLVAPQSIPPAPAPASPAAWRGLDPADRAAWRAFMTRFGLPANHVGPNDLDMVYRSAWEAIRRIHRAGSPSTVPSTEAATTPPAALITSLPAKTATGVPSPAHGGAGRGAASDHTGVGRAAGSEPQRAERPRSERPESAARAGVGAPLSKPPIPAESATAPAPAPHSVASGSPFPSRGEPPAPKEATMQESDAPQEASLSERSGRGRSGREAERPRPERAQRVRSAPPHPWQHIM